MSWITRCLGWKTGNGKNIKVGIDPIAGVSSDYTLLEDLRLYLEDYGIHTLSDVLNRRVSTSSTDYWLSADALELGGLCKEAWSNYIKGLQHGGIRISNTPDTLVWIFNKSIGTVKSNLMYELTVNISVTSKPNDIFVKIWKLRIPLKIICFNWLCLSNRINTCDNLIKKGWIGPNWCFLCRSSSESVNHLFHECSFTRKVIAHIRSSLAIPYFWRETNFILNVSSWISKGNTLKYLPLLFSWQIWWTRNKCVFEDKQPDILFVVHSIKNHLQLYPIINQLKNIWRTIGPAPTFVFRAGFFDGALANRMGGISVHLLLSQDHYFYFKLGVGLSSNTISE